MQKFFDEQMDQVLKSFGLGQGFGGFGATPGGFPPIERPDSDDGSREFMLKDGMGFSSPSESNRKDADLDGDVDKLFKHEQKPPASTWMTPYFESPNPPRSGNFNFSFSSSKSTVRLPDGTVEHRESSRNSDGNETTIVTRNFGDKSHTVTTVRKPNGEEEKTENFVNMTKEDFGKIQNEHASQNLVPFWQKESNQNKSIFDKFFGNS